VLDLLVALLNGLSSGKPVDVSGLLSTPQTYDKVLYDASILIHSTAVKPITGIVISIIGCLMLTNQATRSDGDRGLALRIIGMSLFKIALVLAMCQYAPILLGGIAQISQFVSEHAWNTDIAGAGNGTAGHLGDQMRSALNDGGPLVQSALIAFLMLPWLVVNGGDVIGIVLVFAVFLQLYIMGAFSSLPIAFLGHEETKSIGVGFLKRYGSTALTTTVIVLVVKFYQALVASWVPNLTFDGGDPALWLVGHTPQFLIAPVVLIVMLVKAPGIARAIVGEG